MTMSARTSRITTSEACFAAAARAAAIAVARLRSASDAVTRSRRPCSSPAVVLADHDSDIGKPGRHLRDLHLAEAQRIPDALRLVDVVIPRRDDRGRPLVEPLRVLRDDDPEARGDDPRGD